MTRLLIALLATAVASPALAQHPGHGGHSGHAQAPQRARQSAANPHAGHRAGQRAAPRRARPPVRRARPAAVQAADPHAGHNMGPAPATDPHAGHAGHDMSATQASDPHAGHAMPATEVPAPPVAPPPPEAFSGPAHAADTVHDGQVMSAAREALRAEHGDGTRSRFSIDMLEWRSGGDRGGYAWDDVQFWYGGDYNRLWIKSQGEGSVGDSPEDAEVQVLFSRAIAPFFDVQGGVRQDVGTRSDRTHVVLGLQGLVPYMFEVDAALFLSAEGEVTARLEAEHDVRITRQLFLQPRVEANLSLQDMPDVGLGSGVTSAEAGLRLRYEIVQEFAPYVGVHYERAFGGTRDIPRAAGESSGGWSFVAGVRAWF